MQAVLTESDVEFRATGDVLSTISESGGSRV